MSEAGRTSCKVCIQSFGSRGMETPCESCRPELNSFNIPYVQLFNYCQDQVIMGPNGPVALNLTAVNQAMKDYNVPKSERLEFSENVRLLARHIFRAQAEEAEKLRNKK